MERKPCDHPILKKGEQDIVPFFKDILAKIHVPDPTLPKKIPEHFIEIVIENSDLHRKLILETPKMKRIGKFLNHYDSARGKIFILESNYNLRTFIHEFLHACSVYALNDVRNQYHQAYGIKFGDNLFEGQTEFLTGLILYKYFKRCFDVFKYPSYYYESDEMKNLGYSYSEWTKIWLSIAVNYGVEHVITSYFYKFVHDFKMVQQKYKDVGFFFLFQQRHKDEIHVKLEKKFKNHKECIEKPEVLNYKLLDGQLTGL